MPVSKHRKKGQKKAVKRPGAARVVKVRPWVVQQDAVMDQAMAMLDLDQLEPDEVQWTDVLLNVVIEETMAVGVDGDGCVPRIASRAEVVDRFIDEMNTIMDEEPGEREKFRRFAAPTLDVFEARGIVRFEEDQLIPMLPIPTLPISSRTTAG